MILLGIEGGGTRTSALLVKGEYTVLASFAVGPGNLQLLNGEQLSVLLASIRDQLPCAPDRIGIGMAGVRSASDRERLRRAVAATWPNTPSIIGDDLILALEAGEWPADCAAQVLQLSGTGSCCLGRHRNGASVKVGGRGHIIGDRGSACDIAVHALRSTVTISDIDADWPRLGADMLAFLQMNDPESLIEWSMIASKAEIASLAQVVFEAAVSRQDEIAVAILRRASDRLSKDAIHCAARVAQPGEKVQFLLNGSTLLKNAWFADEVTAKILAARPGSEVIRLSRQGTWGAIALARQAGTQATPKTTAAIASKPTGWHPVISAPTEARNPKSSGFAEMPLDDAIKLMLAEDATLPSKILAESAHLEWTIEAVAKAFASGGRLIYCGAGTSGRLGVLDASECPPTFRTPASLIQGIIAGGRSALWSAVEGAEDDEAAGVCSIASRSITAQDVVIGISASGHAPFVWGCLAEARRRGAQTVLVACNPGYRDHPLLDRAILPDTGPEVLTGSTRLKAGTATKLVLNLITTLALARSGKVVSNLMIDLNPSNTKLRDRATRIVQELAQVDAATAREALETNGWIIRQALAAVANANA
ncbi:MAG: N-acetylmuramic acid 6-phosphate etherase [Verrucomicrobiota bacterium]